jgi:hypothetical protein
MATKTKKLVKSVKVVGKQKTTKVKKLVIAMMKYGKSHLSLRKIETKVFALIQKLAKYPKVIGALPVKSSSQVIPILQLFVLGKLVKGKRIMVEPTCKSALGITRDNFSLRLINTMNAMNKAGIAKIKVERKNCTFVENSKNRIVSFLIS